MGLRYLGVEPLERRDSWLELGLTELHAPPRYLARVRLHAGRKPELDAEHVRDVARPVLERLACADVAAYVSRARVLADARARASALAREGRPAHDATGELSFELASEVVAGTLDPRARPVYRVAWRGEPALTFWLGERGDVVELAWASRLFRADERLSPRALEHGFTYVAWALEELGPVAASLLERPRELKLGWPLPTTV